MNIVYVVSFIMPFENANIVKLNGYSYFENKSIEEIKEVVNFILTLLKIFPNIPSVNIINMFNTFDSFSIIDIIFAIRNNIKPHSKKYIHIFNYYHKNNNNILLSFDKLENLISMYIDRMDVDEFLKITEFEE